MTSDEIQKPDKELAPGGDIESDPRYVRITRKYIDDEYDLQREYQETRYDLCVQYHRDIADLRERRAIEEHGKSYVSNEPTSNCSDHQLPDARNRVFDWLRDKLKVNRP